MIGQNTHSSNIFSVHVFRTGSLSLRGLMLKNWQSKLRKQHERVSRGMSTKSPDWSVGNTAATGMSPCKISRGSRF